VVSYDLFKGALVSTSHFGENDTRTHVLSSALGGTVAVTLVAPIDVVKSRVQSSTGNIVSQEKHGTHLTIATYRLLTIGLFNLDRDP
jgi:hypothetical protein